MSNRQARRPTSNRANSNRDLMAEEVQGFDQKSWMLLTLFLLGITFMFLVIYKFPELQMQQKEKIWKWPRTREDLQDIIEVFQGYTQDHYYHSRLQTFAIPGPVFLSIISGALFGGVQGFCLVGVCATTGASLCYTLSWLLGRNLVRRYFFERLVWFRSKLVKHKDDLLYYLLFLRITPLLPNWFINISSPILDVPYYKFFLATFIGLMPMNVMHVKTGLMLKDVEKIGVDFKVSLLLNKAFRQQDCCLCSASLLFFLQSLRKSCKKNLIEFLMTIYNQLIIKMSVRPIAVSESMKAQGQPWVGIFSLFGTLQGILLYLHRHKIPFQQNWLAPPGSFGVFSLYFVGGYAIGCGVANMFFLDRSLLRLHKRHMEDKERLIDGFVSTHYKF